MEERTYRSICQFCHTNCGIVVYQHSDGTLSVEGDPEHPMNRGRCCPKAAGIPDLIRSKDRLMHPLRKTSNGFERVSWEEALDIAAEKLGEIRDRFGPLSLARCGGAPVSYQCRDGFIQFTGAFGSPNFTGAANLCMVPRMTAFNAITGGSRAEPDYDKTNLVLFWGSDPLTSERFGSYAAYNGMQQIIPRLKERGTRIICIDPFRSKTVHQADAWIRINPGGDIALGLAMIHVIIREALYDTAFVEAYTTGFDALKEHVRAFTPMWAEALTGIPQKSIEDLSRTYATTKPATIYEGNGLDMHATGVDAVRTIVILMGLTGNLDKPGGNVFMPFALQSSLPTKAVMKKSRVGYDRFPLFDEVPFPAIKEALLEGADNRPRAMIVHHSNPVLVQANEKRTRQALKKLDFLIVNDIFPTATTGMADLILPITSDFESYGYRAYASVEGGFLALARPIAAPIGESRPVFEVEYALAQRMGLHREYPFHDTLSWLEYMIRPTGVDFDRLNEEQIVYATPPVRYRKYEDRGFNTPSGKLEFYSQIFKDKGYNPLPIYSEPAGEPLVAGAPRPDKGFSLLGATKRPAQFVHTKLKNIDALSRFYPDPLVWLHPRDAADRGIKEGDTVNVTSPRGEITLKARLAEDTQPGLVWVDFGWGNPTDGKANINVLVNDAYFDPVSGGTPHRLFECEVKKNSSYAVTG
jgi:anaerobic selenocysteine-containing dehydrogenase